MKRKRTGRFLGAHHPALRVAAERRARQSLARRRHDRRRARRFLLLYRSTRARSSCPSSTRARSCSTTSRRPDVADRDGPHAQARRRDARRKRRRSKAIRAAPGCRWAVRHRAEHRRLPRQAQARSQARDRGSDRRAARSRSQRANRRCEVEFVGILPDLIGDLTGRPEPIEIRLFSEDAAALQAKADEVEEAIKKVPGVVDTFNGVDDQRPGGHLQDRSAARRRSLASRRPTSPRRSRPRCRATRRLRFCNRIV